MKSQKQALAEGNSLIKADELSFSKNKSTVAIETQPDEDETRETNTEETPIASVKWIKVTKDTVTAVTASNNFIAWSSQNEAGDYAVFIASFSEYEAHGNPMEFKTGALVQGLDFNSSSNASQLVCADFNGTMYLYTLKSPENAIFEQSADFKVGPNKHLTSISFQRPDKDGWIAGGTDSNDLHLFRVFEDNSQTTIVPAHGTLHGQTDKMELVIKRKGKVLDVEFLWEQENTEFIVADGSGVVCIYQIIGHHEDTNGYNVTEKFSQSYDLSNMECGCMLSSADNGNRFVIACGDKQARVLHRVAVLEELNLVHPHSCVLKTNQNDSWEELISFVQECAILGANMSGDGKRVAVALEDWNAHIYDVSTGCILNTVKSDNRVRSVCLDNEGGRLLAGGFDKKVRHYHIEHGYERTCQFQKSISDRVVQSVSLDREGHLLAIGTGVGHVYLHNLQENDQKHTLVLEAGKVVYVVKLSPDGKFLAIGDYQPSVKLYSVENKEVVWKKEDTKPPSFIWGLDIKQLGGTLSSDTKYVMAVGSWDCNALVYDFSMESGRFNEPVLRKNCSFKRTDRVFDVCLSENANMLALAGRDCKAVLYNLASDNPVLNAFEFEDADRVYCVALSPGAVYLAFGGVAKQVKVYRVAGRVHVQTYKHENTVHRMSFFGESHLIAISEDGRCVIYDVSSAVPFFQLKLEGAGNSVSVSSIEKGVLAVGHGCTASFFGSQQDGYGPLDRPSFKVVNEMLDDPESLRIALKSHPTLANVFDRSGNTLLHRAIKKGNNKAVSALLQMGVKNGLLENKSGKTALHLALEKSNRVVVEEILSAINSQGIINTPDIFASMLKRHDSNAPESSASSRGLSRRMSSLNVMGKSAGKLQKKSLSAFEMLGKSFPDSLLRFLAKFGVQDCGPLIMGKLTHACLRHPLYIGFGRRCPNAFWERFYEVNQDRIEAFSSILPAFSVQAYRIPFPGLCGVREPGENGEEIICKPLDVIVEAARMLQDYSVFGETTIVHAMVRYKWSVIDREFKQSFYVFLAYLGIASFEGWILAYTAHLTLYEAVKCWEGILSLAMSPVLMCGSAFYMWREICQFRAEYDPPKHKGAKWHEYAIQWWEALMHHFVSDPWNLLDFVAFTTQLIVSCLVFTPYKITIAVDSCSILLLYWKILFYARGFKVWGPFVRMIQQLITGMSSFLLVLMVVLSGFAVSFSVLLHDYDGFRTLGESMLTVTVMIYGDFHEIRDTFGEKRIGAVSVMLFEVMMLICLIMMLNLLIAILSESYQEVKKHASQETVFELANIVIELERVNKYDKKTNQNQRVFEALHPQWVHVLKFSEHAKILDEQSEIQNCLQQISASLNKAESVQVQLLDKMTAMESKMLDFEGSLNKLQVD